MVKIPPHRPGLKLIEDESHRSAEDDWDGFVTHLYAETQRANAMARGAVEALQALLSPDLMLTPADAAAVEGAIRAYRAGTKAREAFARSFTALRTTQETVRRPEVAA